GQAAHEQRSCRQGPGRPAAIGLHPLLMLSSGLFGASPPMRSMRVPVVCHVDDSLRAAMRQVIWRRLLPRWVCRTKLTTIAGLARQVFAEPTRTTAVRARIDRCCGFLACYLYSDRPQSEI